MLSQRVIAHVLPRILWVRHWITSTGKQAWKFLGCNDSSVRNVKFINSAQTHMLVKGCNDFIIENVIIESPENSPNTDGIHIQSSHHLLITNSTIACGNLYTTNHQFYLIYLPNTIFIDFVDSCICQCPQAMIVSQLVTTFLIWR